MIKLSKKIMVSALCIGCLYSGSNLFGADPIIKKIEKAETTTQAFALPTEDGNMGSFVDGKDDQGNVTHGSVNVQNLQALIVTAPNATDDQHFNLTLSFENDPSAKIDQEQNSPTVHVCSRGGTSIATSLGEKVDLKLDAKNGKRPILMSQASGSATCIKASGKNLISIDTDSELLSETAAADVAKTASVVVGNAVVGGDGVKCQDVCLKVNQGSTLATSAVAANGPSAATVVGASGSFEDAQRIECTGLCELSAGNVLSAYAHSSGSVAAATVFGSALPSTNGTNQSVMTVNMSGNQTISALAYGQNGNASNTKINVFGADKTDAADVNTPGWRVGINGSSTVNILGANLSKAIEFDDVHSTAKITLAVGQDDVRAFAIGEDFQIYVGGKNVTSADGQEQFVQCPGSGVVNVFGWINAADPSIADRVARSKITVDSGYKVNVFGETSNLKSIDVKRGELNTFGGLSNSTITGGTVNAFGAARGMKIENGTLRLCKCNNNGSEAAMGQTRKNLTILNNGKTYSVSEIESQKQGEGENEKTFYSNFGTSGYLQLKSDVSPETSFCVKTDERDTTVSVKGAHEFQKVNGRIFAEAENSLHLEGGYFKAIDIATEKVAADKLALLFVQCPDLTIKEMLGEADLTNKFDKVEGADDLYVLKGATDTFLQSDDAIDPSRKIYAKDYIGIGIMGLEDAKALYTPCDACRASGALSTINIAAVSMFREAVNPRLTDVKGNGNDPFITAIGGHVHQNVLSGIGYSGDLYGVAGGMDKLFLIDRGGYLRVGGMLGYIYGDIDFRGAAVGKKETAKQDNYLAAVYGAYETFDEKGLKTNIDASLGFGYTEHKLSRTDKYNKGYSAKMKSNNIFLSAEFIKNLYAIQGIQFGVWLRADYNHIHQKAYSEKGGASAQSVSRANFDFIDTTIGINIEKEFQDPSDMDKRLKVYMKAGWSCQPVRSHSTIVGSIHGKSNSVNPSFGSRSSAVFVAGCRQKIDANWDVIGEWNGSFNKEHSNNVLTLSVGYNF